MLHAETSGAKHLVLPRLFGRLKPNVKSAQTRASRRVCENIPNEPHVQISHSLCCITSIRIFQLIFSICNNLAHTGPFAEERACDSQPSQQHFPTPYSCDHPGATCLTDLD